MTNIITKLEKVLEEDKEILSKLSYLRARWQDEKYYEDFSDYKEFAKKLFFDTNFSLTNLTKQFKISLFDKVTEEKVFIKLNARSYQLISF